MPVFTYTARDRGGQVSTGTVEAESNAGAVSSLREQGLWVTDLRVQGARRREQPGAGPVEGGAAKKMFSPVSLKDLSLFYRQLHTLLNSGMAFYQSLETLSHPNQSPNAQLRRVVAELAQHVLVGGRLSDGMARFPWLFDKMQIRMIEAAEMGGLLVDVLERLATYLEREYELRLEIKRKTLYPKLLAAAVIFIPPIPTLVLRGFVPYLWAIWNILQYGVFVILPLFLVIRYLVTTTQGGRSAYDQVKLAIPVIGPLVRKLAVARFARTLGALYGAGVPIMSATKIAGEASGTSVLERYASTMGASLEKGVSIAETMNNAHFFPPMFVGMVSTGETTGNLDGMLNKAADFYEEEAKHASIQLVVILGVALLLLMAIIIAIQVIGFWGGYGGSVGNATGE